MQREDEQTTRKNILQLLKTQYSMSISELAHQLGITEVAVRRHISIMERDGLIVSKILKPSIGRPMKQYSLTSLAEDYFPKNYSRLTLDFLSEIEQEDHEWIAKLFEKRKDKLYKKYQHQMQGKSLPEKVEELARIQNAGGYMAKWESNEQGDYVFTEYNCPISQVANQYQDACQCELKLFQELLGSKVERTECLAKDGRQCTYLIQKERK